MLLTSIMALLLMVATVQLDDTTTTPTYDGYNEGDYPEEDGNAVSVDTEAPTAPEATTTTEKTAMTTSSIVVTTTAPKTSELCVLLRCSFDVDGADAFCRWKADPPKNNASWQNGDNIENYNHFTNIYKDADQINKNKTRGHAEAAGSMSKLHTGLPRVDGLVLSSPEFTIEPDIETTLEFKYWVATYGTALRLCLDDPKCKCSSNDNECLFESRFDNRTKANPETTDGPLRSWRPCKHTNGKPNCSTAFTQSVPLPPGTHKLHFIADGIYRYASVGVDNIFTKESNEREACGPRTKERPPPVCWHEGWNNKTLINPQISHLVAAGEKNWDQTLKGCQLFCIIQTAKLKGLKSEKSCRSIAYFESPKSCILFNGVCDDDPSKCLEGEAQYYELEFKKC